MISTDPVLNPRLYCVSHFVRVRRAASARISWGVSFCIESELPQREHERISTRVAHDLRDQVSSGMGDEISVPRAEGRGCPSSAGADPANMPRFGCSDRKGPRPQGSCAHTRVDSADRKPLRSDEADKRSVVPQKFLRNKLQQEFAHLRKRYWGRHFWA